MVAYRRMQGSQITQDIKPVYLLASAEPLLARDWLDDARRALREAGFEDILNLQTDVGFNWQELLEEGDMMSLFSESKCRIVTMPGGKPGQQGSKVIKSLCENPAAGNVYIFVTPALDRQSKNASWCKAIQADGQNCRAETGIRQPVGRLVVAAGTGQGVQHRSTIRAVPRRTHRGELAGGGSGAGKTIRYDFLAGRRSISRL